MKTKTEKLKGAALDWAVLMAEGCSKENLQVLLKDWLEDRGRPYLHHNNCPSTDWAQGGPIIARCGIRVDRHVDTHVAYTDKYWWPEDDCGGDNHCGVIAEGGTYLEAAMHCYVMAKLGAEVEIPDELKELA